MRTLEAPATTPRKQKRVKFRVGPFVYTVRVWDKAARGPLRLRGGDGGECSAIWDCCDRAIWISTDLPRQCWLEAFAHECWHAFEYHAGHDPHAFDSDARERRANAAATFALDFHRQMRRQGGAAALKAMQPEGDHAHA